VLQEDAQRLIETIGKALQCGGRNIHSAATFEQRGQVVLTQELACLLVLLFLAFEHLVVKLTRLVQTGIEATALLAIGVQNDEGRTTKE
jgi:hypothetical protein